MSWFKQATGSTGVGGLQLLGNSVCDSGYVISRLNTVSAVLVESGISMLVLNEPAG